MTLSFRNVDAETTDPVCNWPQEALQSALERGDISHWRRIVTEIRRSPWGPVARSVAQILTYSRPYGVAPLMERAIDRARTRSLQSEIDEVAGRIHAARDASGLSVKQFAAEVGTSASRMSTYLSGRVIPSAAMLVRIERLGARRASD
jgi:DNA-binding transcriptional regulator YiaG